MSDTRYLLSIIKTCPECQGSGVITHPGWDVFNSEHPHGWSDYAELERWFSEQGYPTVPDEGQTCPTCEGEGAVEETMDIGPWMADVEKRLAKLEAEDA